MDPTKILIVEDNNATAAWIEDVLKQEGYSVSLATDGRSGLELARKEKPAIVLLDIMIPEMDGFKVCRAICEDPQTAGVKVIMLTALNRRVDMDMAQTAGAVDYITKPFNSQHLIARIKEVLKS